MNAMKRITNLKGGTYQYKGREIVVEDQYVIDGQVVLVADGKEMKFDKSSFPKAAKEFKNTRNGSATEDETAGTFYRTRDYNKFVYNKKNRAINKAHVKNLVSSIAQNDLLHVQPILVNEKFDVIDGQHRLAAAKELGREIFYIVSQGLTIEDAITLNINTKNWGYGDYMEYWIAQKNPNYVYYKKYKNRYSMSYTLAISLLHAGSAMGARNLKRFFENGEFRAEHQEYAEFIGRLTLLAGRYGKFTNDRSFIRALDKSIQKERLDPWLFLHKLEQCPDKFQKCSDTDSYLRMMEDIINYNGRGERIRLY